MGARGVSREAIAEAAEVVAEKIDVLLERATDTVLGAPRPGSPAWRQQWELRESESGRAALEHRALVKIAIADLAGVDLHHEIERARRAGMPTPRTTTAGDRRTRGRGRQTGAPPSPRTTQAAADQLAIW